MSDRGDRIGVLFVCMGNICRSPLAEGVFIHLARERGVLDRFNIDSAGTGGWHRGNPADPRSIAVAEKHGIQLPSRARRIDPATDWDRFAWIIVMDRDNHERVIEEGAPPQRVRLLRSFDDAVGRTHDELLLDSDGEIPDPYYGADDGFSAVFRMVFSACEGLLDKLCER